MSTNLPDFEKAQYIAEVEPQLATGHGLTGAAWDGVQADGGFWKAMAAGVFGALLGSVAYAAFTLITHIEIGFVALFLGAFIAGAMMNVTGGVGGRRYQISAAALTYLSVTMAVVIEALWQIHAKGTDLSRISLKGYVAMTIMALLWPFLSLRHFVSGAIGLFILFLAMRSAWSVAAGKKPNG